ncbi:MAG: TonB-dependent receptor [Deltaproteobacteria bacterium]|jgi:iron complex outermembrane receptor protein|nr:TonB-dependent receptor [Deltaproteobacteria bacterium]
MRRVKSLAVIAWVIVLVLASCFSVNADTEALPPVLVEGEAATEPEGTEEKGYVVKSTTATGPWGRMELLNTPYSINVMSSELLQNSQAGNTDYVYRMNPVIQPWTSGARGISNFIIRGFSTPNTSGRMQDGMRSMFLQLAVEDKERIEVLSGVSGFLYGPANVGGTINYVLKRPTTEAFSKLRVGGTGGENYYAHVDMGGPLGNNGVFGYRLNILGQDGHTAVDDQRLKRSFVSGAIDIKPSDNLLIQLNGAYHNFRSENGSPTWATAAGVRSPKALDTSKNWLNTDTALFATSSYEFGARVKLDISEAVSFRAGYQYDNIYQKDQVYVNNTINRGFYTSAINSLTPLAYDMMAGYLYGDFKFNTGPIGHNLTMGFNIDDYVQKQTSLLGSLNTTAELTQTNFIIGDQLSFGDKWSALLGLNYANIKASNYNVNTRLRTADDYDKSKATPSFSLMFKPVPEVTLYATYMEAMEKGSFVPLVSNPLFTNAGQSLPAFISEQYEFGAKAELGGMLLTLALFEIDKALEYDLRNPNNTQTRYQSGRQVHRGVEFTATGKVFDDLTLYGGLTFLDAKVKKQRANPALEGNRPANVSNNMIKLYAEYNIPFISGATLTGGLYHFGALYADIMNTDRRPAVTVFDLGARYRININDRPLTFRLDVTNVTNKNYWMNGLYLGLPRALLFSVEYPLW